MFAKKQLERVLKVNGVSLSDSDEVIRQLFISARYSAKEVEQAMQVLRENVTSRDESLDSAHKIFRNDSVLNAGDISKLLGVDVRLGSAPEPADAPTPNATPLRFALIGVIVITILICVSFIFVGDVLQFS